MSTVYTMMVDDHSYAEYCLPSSTIICNPLWAPGRRLCAASNSLHLIEASSPTRLQPAWHQQGKIGVLSLFFEPGIIDDYSS